MWWFIKNKQVKTESLIDEVRSANLAQEQKLKQEIHELLKLSYACTPAIDFGQMRVVSIERLLQETTIKGITIEVPVTCIGYIGDDNTDGHYTKEMKEWYIRCNDKHHEQLVKDFKEYLTTRKASW